jgi:hypothetical protein
MSCSVDKWGSLGETNKAIHRMDGLIYGEDRSFDV